MTKKQKELLDILTRANDHAIMIGKPYIGKKEKLEEICSDPLLTDEIIDRIINDEYIKSIGSGGSSAEGADIMSDILWYIYLNRYQPQPWDSEQEPQPARQTWETMREALLELSNQKPFFPVAQSAITNALSFLPTSETEWEQNIDGSATSSAEKVDFLLMNADTHNMRVTVKKLKDCLLRDYSDHHSERQSIPLRQYAILRGKDPDNENSMKALRKQTVEDLELLGDLRWNYREKIGNKYVDSGFIRLNGGTACIKKGRIEWNWNRDIIPLLNRMDPIDYSLETFRANDRTAAYDFSFYFDVNYRRNEDKKALRKTWIKTLLGKTGMIPSVEKIKSQRGSVRDRVIRPFFEALDSLDRILYDVYTEDGERVQDPRSMDPEDFLRGYLVIDYKAAGYPQHPERTEKRDAWKKKAQKKKNKKGT